MPAVVRPPQKYLVPSNFSAVAIAVSMRGPIAGYRPRFQMLVELGRRHAANAGGVDVSDITVRRVNQQHAVAGFFEHKHRIAGHRLRENFAMACGLVVHVAQVSLGDGIRLFAERGIGQRLQLVLHVFEA